MGKKKHTPQKQASAWVDFKHFDDGSLVIGIETDDESLTFDGHFICLFPEAPGEKDSEPAMKRARAVLDYMQGKKQMRRGV